MRKFIIAIISCTFSLNVFAQIDAGLFRYPDVSQTQIVFSYANDLWIIPKDGGTAIKLSSPPGVESYPKFSPDGKSIAFSGNYDGNNDVYVLPVNGGVPVRLTEHGYPDRVIDWTNDGKRVVFASIRESGKARFNQFYTVSANGGADNKLPFAYAEYGSYSPDGNQMALVFRSQVGRNWKRYRGGWKADIVLYNFQTNVSEYISQQSDAGYEFPMWHANTIYFLSDRGEEERMNLWKYDLSSKVFTQLTKFTDYDVHYPSLGPDDIVFEAGGKLYLYSLSSQQQKEINVNVITDEALLKPKIESVEKLVQHVSLSADGNRVLVEARGDIFSVPAKDGYVKDLTRTSGVAERYPAYSPDGKTMAYWSDSSGEYELWIADMNRENSSRKLTSYGAGFRYSSFWSPDSKKLAFVDKAMRIKIYDVTTNQTTDVDKALRYSDGALDAMLFSWSSDSRWLAYTRDLENQHNTVFIYDYKNKHATQAVSGFYNCYSPVFSADGKYLYVVITDNFTPYYSDIDNSFIYANSSKIGVISLNKTTPSLIAPKNDTVEIKADEKKSADDEKSNAKKDDKQKKDEADKDKSNTKNVDIDFNGFEQRLVLLPLSAGNYGKLASAEGKIIYQKLPNTGSPDDAKPSLKYFDIDKREEKNIMDAVDNYWVSADGKKILVQKESNYAIVDPDENQKFEKPLRLSEMQMMINPKQEWRQLFTDAWRIERDYFYDANMHGVDWNKVRERYSKMLAGAMTREEVDFIIGEMIGELSSSHTYHGGGDVEHAKNQNVGYLGVNWEADGNYYKIKKIIHGANWDAEAHSSLDAPGVNIHEGDYILAVNGVPLTTAQEPYSVFQGLAKKTVELTYNSTPSFTNSKTAIVQTLDDEYRLRNLAWIEAMRAKVDSETNGDVGYIYVPSTGTDGQSELIREFSAQWDKKALIIDERFNDGGQIPDRFIEMLNRTPLAYWAIRDGESWPWPPNAHFGPKVMLINGWSGSGGDAFPDYFRKKGLGPLIGERTWGGLIGVSGCPSLIDGGGITVPTFRMYNQDGTWFKEGHGVDPDIEVREDLGAMSNGIDPQLERGIA
ncbi:MAG: PD40 domain-containing protein, partial [Parafilimonas sp.]|nr:PD40 domain-containing protein [Parafilimonas sp.]